MRRPSLLINAARYVAARKGERPAAGLATLREREQQLDQARRERSANYSVSAHIEALARLMMLRAA